MATVNPMRLVEDNRAGKWSSSASSSMAAEELGLLLKGHKLYGSGKEVIPNRSGSAPPSMEGSFAAMGNIMARHSSNLDTTFANSNISTENCESEEQVRADPAYFAYYSSNINLNPRLPLPQISPEDRRLVRHIGGFGNSWKMTSLDDSGDGSFRLSHGILSTHKEESEDDKSPRPASREHLENSDTLLSSHGTTFAGRHKSLVDLIQEDFPRTPSPVYNHPRSLIYGAAEEAVDPNGHLLQDPSTSSSKLLDPNATSSGVSAGERTLLGHGVSGSNSSSGPAPGSSTPDGRGSLRSGQNGKSSSADNKFEGKITVNNVADSDTNNIESEFKSLNLSGVQDRRNQHNNLQHHNMRSQQGVSHQNQGAESRVASQGISRVYNGTDQFSQGHSKMSSMEVQPVLPSSGVTPPIYGPATAYMTSGNAPATAYMTSGNAFYPNLQPSGLFAPQFSIGGYPLNTTLMHPYMPGYPPHNAVPMAFDPTAGSSFNARAAAVSNVGNVPAGVDLQHPYKFYGQLGLPLQPFTDPLYMQYFQHPAEGVYGASSPYEALVPRGGPAGNQLDAQKGPPAAAYTADQKSQYQRSVGLNIPNVRKGGITSPNYYGSPPNVNLLMQFPTSPLSSPIIPASPVGGLTPAGRRNDMRFPPNPMKNTGVWQGTRGTDRFEDPKTYSFLDELKSSKARKFELSDIGGRIVEFSADQHGSRFIQQKLENCTTEEKASVFREVLPHASKLMTDVFGNYVIQKFFEHGSTEQRKELADQLAGHILPLSLQMYGCRVIQKALEVIDHDQKTQLVHELDGHVMRCVRDQNGNHVIQKCIECVPSEKIAFIISAFRGQVATLSVHPYGCRVIQRVLEHCTDDRQCQCIVDEILESACTLAQDQYGNYVTQHVLEKGKPSERTQIISKLAGQIVQMSQHKFASNVIEKCLQHGGSAERELLIDEIVGQSDGNDKLLIMMKDQYANYVVQKILGVCTDEQREILLSRIRVHLHALKKYTYGKHIVVRFEELFGEEVNVADT
ncbi:hypothetical protein Sjap_023037 [Stephania japonica]|uniref:PUM-HD domain-containing protein n=1 Tax=Stephania japonica TaxID=461633 RepID=A0AAP0EPZ6_9MAGN